MRNATRSLQPTAMQPFATWNPTRGAWETSQLDLSGQPAPYSAIWPTSGWMHDGSVYQLPSSAHPITAIASSSLPIAGTLFRTPLASDSARGSETLDQVCARRGTIALSHQVIDIALNGPPGSRAKYNESETLWSLIQSILDAGGGYARAIARWEHITGRPAPSPTLLNDTDGPRPSPEFVEWLMGLPSGWVSASEHGLTVNQQMSTLGNGVLSLQALAAIPPRVSPWHGSSAADAAVG